jgi:hypothetical protein
MPLNIGHEHRVVVAALIVLVLAPVSGCQTDGPAVPSLGGGSGSSDAVADQRRAADEYAVCMADAGVEIERRESESGEVAVDPAGFGWVLRRAPDGTIDGLNGSSPHAMPTDWEAQFSTLKEGDAGLIIDGRDVSSEYANCLDASGYVEPASTDDYSAELASKQAVVDETNKWIACARENGFPDFSDLPAPVADGFATDVSFYIPLTTDPVLLESVLEKCPIYNEPSPTPYSDRDDLSPGQQAYVPGPVVNVPRVGADGESLTPDEEARRMELNLILFKDLSEIMGFENNGDVQIFRGG